MKLKLATLTLILATSAFAAEQNTAPVGTAAQPPVPSNSTNPSNASGVNPSDFIEQSDNSFNEEMKMDSRLKHLEKQVLIMQKQKEIEKLSPAVIGSNYGVPYVKALEGYDKKFTALIMFENGVEYETSVGDTLPNGMRVTKVSPGDVRVKSGKKEYRLGFINPSQIPSDTSSNNSGMNGLVPSIPTTYIR